MTPEQLIDIARRQPWTSDYPLIQDSTPKVTLTAAERDKLVALVMLSGALSRVPRPSPFDSCSMPLGRSRWLSATRTPRGATITIEDPSGDYTELLTADQADALARTLMAHTKPEGTE